VGLGSPASEQEPANQTRTPPSEPVVAGASTISVELTDGTQRVSLEATAPLSVASSGSSDVAMSAAAGSVATKSVAAPKLGAVESLGARSSGDVIDPHADVDRFSVVDALVQHQYHSEGISDPPAAAGFPAVVRKEWNRLSRHLPPGIFVHASEARLDMLRAAIVGPADTPYENILFFFDLWLPSNYPATPPKVHFMSHNRRLNPNLYEDGKVCLSILGTWDGEGVEKWDPRNSNVLRVLLSLQAMVFVDEPYFNEAGYEKQTGSSEGKSNSRIYNESTLLLSLRHAISSLRQGGVPEDFIELTRSHYAAVGEKILSRCRRFLGNEAVSSPANSAMVACDSAAYGSVGFKRSLGSLFPRLEAALQAGAHLV
jgi:ubiquitin-conjugating enzyme E2 O